MRLGHVFSYPPPIGIFRLAPLAPILHYDKLDDPTGFTWEGGLLRYILTIVFIASGFSTSTLVNDEARMDHGMCGGVVLEAKERRRKRRGKPANNDDWLLRGK